MSGPRRDLPCYQLLSTRQRVCVSMVRRCASVRVVSVWVGSGFRVEGFRVEGSYRWKGPR